MGVGLKERLKVKLRETQGGKRLTYTGFHW
jgi:hypothetical protein